VSDAGFAVGGIEVSAAMHDETCRLLGAEHEPHLGLGDFLRAEMPSAKDSCSLVYWNDVFEHVPPDEIRDYLDRIYRMLVPGGQLITVTPNWHVRPSDITRGFFPPRNDSAGLHLKEYTLGEVHRLLRQTGFSQVATPLVILPQRVVLFGRGLIGPKRFFEPVLEWLPFSLARLLCRGFALSTTIATK
jgi:SAM-dependent methyltransferase